MNNTSLTKLHYDVQRFCRGEKSLIFLNKILKHEHFIFILSYNHICYLFIKIYQSNDNSFVAKSALYFYLCNGTLIFPTTYILFYTEDTAWALLLFSSYRCTFEFIFVKLPNILILKSATCEIIKNIEIWDDSLQKLVNGDYAKQSCMHK